jgi:predicted Zn-dependent protease with MMP-like domain
MAAATDSETFEEIVEWAYSTLPQKIRDLPDFPGIQVVDEPPAEIFRDISNREKWRRGTELLGLYSGIHRTEPHYNRVRIAPDLIFVFRGPILRCSRGDLRAEVKRVVWHEVAHWLGHDEEEVKELGLATVSLGVEDVAHHPLESEAPKTLLQQRLPDTLDEAGAAEEQQPRCIKCYSAEVTCRELDKPLTNSGAWSGAWLSDPLPVHAKIWTCNSCGYEWDDEDNT